MRSDSQAGLVRHGGLGLLLAVVLSCSDDRLVGPPVVSTDELKAALTEDLSAGLSADGRFVLAEPAPSPTTVTKERARELIWAYWKRHERTWRYSFDRDRGAPLAANLEMCPWSYYAHSGFDPVESPAPTELRRAWGSKWIFGLCSGAEQQVALAVSDEVTNLKIETSGDIHYVRSGDFFLMAVPIGRNIPAPPEWSAVSTSKKVRARVSGVPILQRRGDLSVPVIADWVFPIETSTLVRGHDSEVERSVSALAFGEYFGRGRVEHVPLDADPEYAAAPRGIRLTAMTSPTTSQTFTILRRLNVPARRELVEALGTP
jgi:hypothetical protein